MPTMERTREGGGRARVEGSSWSPDEFTALVRDHDRSLRMLAYRLLGDRQLMDDVLQEAYLRAYKALPSFRNEGSAATWLYRITYNACIDQLRSRQRGGGGVGAAFSLEELAEGGLEPASETSYVDEVGRKEELARALARLPAEHRAAVLLVDAIGYDYRDAAGILGVREGTLASRLHHARALLRLALSASRQREER